MKKIITSVSIDPVLRKLAQEKGLSPSKLLDDVLRARITDEEYKEMFARLTTLKESQVVVPNVDNQAA